MEMDPKIVVSILRVLKDSPQILGGDAIARQIQSHGMEVSGRTVRLYLQIMEGLGLVSHSGRGRGAGRTITESGLEEIEKARVLDRVGLTVTRVDTLAYQMDFDPVGRTGKIVLNLSFIEESQYQRALAEMIPVFESGWSMGKYLLVLREGQSCGPSRVPAGKIAIGTVCSVTLNGVLLRAGIPTLSKFGGVLEVHQGRPTRFTDVIYYDGTSLDPLEIFIKAGLTRVSQAVRTGDGRIGVSFREVPTAALADVERIQSQLQKIGLDGIVQIGKPNQPLIDFPVHEGRTGILVAAGLNPAAAVEEAGIPTRNSALCTLYEFEKLVHYSEVGNSTE